MSVQVRLGSKSALVITDLRSTNSGGLPVGPEISRVQVEY